MIDLHMHTHYSDGRYSPLEVIKAASKRRINVLAITDHDNTRGSREAQSAAKSAGIDLIPGIEFTTAWPEANLPAEDNNVDLLGYFMDLEDPAFQAFENLMLDDIYMRIAWCCGWLCDQGIPITIEAVRAENPRYSGMLQLIDALAHKKLARDWDSAFSIAAQAWLAAPLPACHISVAIHQIHRAGGIAILAHPTMVNPNGQPLDADFLAKLVEMGLDGIEPYHYRVKEDMRKHFLALAARFNLLTSGGSDMHGWHEGFKRLGSQPITPDMLERMGERAAHYAGRKARTLSASASGAS